jgi:hypothetical protein
MDLARARVAAGPRPLFMRPLSFENVVLSIVLIGEKSDRTKSLWRVRASACPMIFKVYPRVGSIKQRLKDSHGQIDSLWPGAPHNSQRNGPSSSPEPFVREHYRHRADGNGYSAPLTKHYIHKSFPRFAATFRNHVALKIQQFRRRLTLPSRSAVRGAGPNPGSGKRYDRHSARI